MSRERVNRPSVLLVNWRDTAHPQGGGSERYNERIARGLVERGHRVTVQCAAHANAPADEWVDGVRFRRQGGPWTFYLWAMVAVLRLRPDVVVDVHAGMPCFTRLVARCPVVVLVHHVHREQWPRVVGRFLGRIGWWVESRLSPLLYRKCRYVTVSEQTRREFAGLGVPTSRTTVVRNGHDLPPPVHASRDREPTLVVVGRVVPHKQVEHAVDVVSRLAGRWPKLRLEVVGTGWWLDKLSEHISLRDLGDRVTLHGYVSEEDKHEILARSWVHLCPSVKEGWGIAIMEAAAHGVPSVAYHHAGGVAESIVDKETGLLANDLEELTRHVDRLLASAELRTALGEAGRERAATFGWERSVDEFERVLVEAARLRG